MHCEAPPPEEIHKLQCEDSVPSVIEPVSHRAHNREIAISRDRVPKSIKQVLEQYHGGFELVSDAEEARLLAALIKYPSKLTWRRRYNKDVPSDTGICSPYGWLEVHGVGGFIVSRNDEPLCHP